jgi:predicted DNA binding CopG/RHH family protein
MVMSDNNLYFLNDHLFARKGEAVPAPIQKSTFKKEPPLNLCGALHGGVARGVDSVAMGARSSMSFLIHRHGKPALDQAPIPAAGEEAASLIKRQVLAEGNQHCSWKPNTEVFSELDARREKGKNPRRQLTLRLTQEDFCRIKSLAEFAGISYQQVLERAVKSYVHSPNESEIRSIGQRLGAKGQTA